MIETTTPPRFMGHTGQGPFEHGRRQPFAACVCAGFRQPRLCRAFKASALVDIARGRSARRRRASASAARRVLSRHAGCRNRQDQELDRERRAGHRSGRAAARREHRRGGPRHGQFRARAAAAGQAARRLAQYSRPTSASGADRILDDSALFDDLAAAIADCTLVLATTARAHDQAKPVLGPDEAAAFLAPHVAAGENVAVLFGRERYGLENHEVALADRIVTFPVNPAFASLNLAQAVALDRLRVVQACIRRRASLHHAAEVGAGRQGAGAGFLRQSRTPARCRSNIFDRWTSAPPCWSICATSSRACSRPSRTSRPCTGSWWR